MNNIYGMDVIFLDEKKGEILKRIFVNNNL